MLEIRRFRPQEWRQYRDVRLRALQDAPNAFGSTFAIERDKPDDYWMARLESAAQSSEQLPLAAEQDGRLVGLVWGVVDPQNPEAIHVIQMWVDPGARGKGCGFKLLDAVIRWAKERKARSVHLRVTTGDTSATRLYLRAGFRSTGFLEPLRPDSSELTQPMTLSL